jgi:threonine aldolase
MTGDGIIDLYSDTKSLPTDAMRRFMLAAPVGDEQKDEDPTTRALCERAASLLGQEAAVFLPSGTMCNEIAIAVHCRPGEEVLCHADAHIIAFEGGGPAALSGVMIRAIAGRRGIFTAEALRAAIRPENRYAPRQRLVCVEQTANLGGGSVWPLATVEDVARAARQAGLSLHLDGARLFNAVVASGIAADAYAGLFDSAWLDLTKGLGCPVGAVLAGSRDFIREAWRFKQRWGGALRQSGILAAAGLYALDHHVERLAEDHANAARLGAGLAEIDGIRVETAPIETNILYFDVGGTGLGAAAFVEALKAEGVGMGAFGASRVRAVTHLGVSADGIERSLAACLRVARSGRRPK